jgi:Cu2+-exporting ATPase
LSSILPNSLLAYCDSHQRCPISIALHSEASRIPAILSAMLPKTKHQPIDCYHCNLPVPDPGQFQLLVADNMHEFCCAGCMAVSETINGSGLSGYYRQRDLPALKPGDEAINDGNDFSGFDHATVQTGWVRNLDEKSCEATFLLIGIVCGACVWLIETYLQKIVGIRSAQINFSSNQMKLVWDPQLVKVSDIIQAVARIGYQAQPYTREARFRLLDAQRNQLLKRFGVAAALGMQVMVLSVALYSGEWFGIDENIATFLRRVSLLLTLPILVYSAKPFFKGAITSLRSGRAGMDVPISLGILLAFIASLWATVENSGEVYFDSIAMFVFFILGARYIELNTRIRGSRAMEPLTSAVPVVADRIVDNGSNNTQRIPVAELQSGDLVRVKPGSVIPVDGQIVEGASSFNESLLSGESHPLVKRVGESVIAGSINVEQAVTIRVNHTGDKTVLSSIQRLADKAALEKPRITQFAESIAGWFIAAVLLIALLLVARGIFADSPDWLATTIAVLIVSCPCALSLATPLALSAGSNAMIVKGLFVAHQHSLETLPKVNHVVFDKTGTLTNGELSLVQVQVLADPDAEQCTAIACALESQSDHPIAQSLTLYTQMTKIPTATDLKSFAGAGVSGKVENAGYYLGSFEFLREQNPRLHIDSTVLKECYQEDKISILLADQNQLLAVFMFSDEIKPGAIELIDYLHHLGINTTLLSGDRRQLVEHVAQQLGIDSVYAEYRPQQKAELLEQLIDAGDIVAMVGDGINDAPALNLAHLSVAVARDINLSSVNADMVMMNPHIEVLINAIDQARRTLWAIRQNVVWALLYNVSAIPLAIMGLVPPWLAAIGMSLSSVVVVLNSSRLLRLKSVPRSAIN